MAVEIPQTAAGNVEESQRTARPDAQTEKEDSMAEWILEYWPGLVSFVVCSSVIYWVHRRSQLIDRMYEADLLLAAVMHSNHLPPTSSHLSWARGICRELRRITWREFWVRCNRGRYLVRGFDRHTGRQIEVIVAAVVLGELLEESDQCLGPSDPRGWQRSTGRDDWVVEREEEQGSRSAYSHVGY